jgi:hypothetical protein
MDISYEYQYMSQPFKDMVNLISDRINNAMNTKTEANKYLLSWYELSAHKNPILMDYIFMILLYHRGENMFDGLSGTWYNHNFTKVKKSYPMQDFLDNDFGKDIKVYLTAETKKDEVISRLSECYLLICNNSEGAWIPIRNFALTRPGKPGIRHEKLHPQEFKNKFMQKLQKWNGALPTPQGWGFDRFYDITDIFTTEINMLGFINWPLENPRELI